MKPMKTNIRLTNYRQLVEFLKRNNLSIATAESCTGGLIAKMITDIPGASDVFGGGMVTYSNEMKNKWLGVNKTTLQKYGAVSAETVREMVNGILKRSGADIGVAVSGIAGPTGGSKTKPVGTVFIGIGFKEIRVQRKFHFQGNRDNVRKKSALSVPELISNLFKE